VRRRGGTVLAAVALLVGSWLLAATPAAAHALVVGSNPQAGARIARAPAELRVAFSEAVRPLGPGLTLQGPRGQVRLGPVRHPDGRPEVLAATLPTLGDGSYLAGWRIVSADDGHLEAGSFAFAVGAGSGPVASPAPPQLPTPWQVAGRWLETAGMLLLVGIVTAALMVWRRPEPIGPDEPHYWAVTVAAVVVGALGLAWQVAAGAATTGGLGPGAVGAFLTASPATGRRMLVELVLLAAIAVLVWWGARRGRRPGLGALALTAGAVVTLALGAHDTGLSPRWLFIPLEAVHLLAVGAWIGGLAVLALTARLAKLDAVRRFSVLALRAVAVVAVTGIWQGLAQVSSRAALTGTDYGRVLAVKAAVFLVVLGLAAVARLRLLPRASAQPDGTPGALRRLLAVEATGGAVVVLVAALLANTVPAGEVLAAASAARVRGGPQAQQLQAGPLRLQLGLEPGTVGRNLLQIQVTNPQGRPVDGLARIDLTVADQAGRAAPTTIRAARVAPATYRAVTDAFALTGNWRVGVAVPGAPPGLAASFAIAATPATAGAPPPDPPDALVLGGQAGSALAVLR
jgi:copper transport protein